MKSEVVLTGSLLLPLAVIGLAAIYWDVKKNKIPNKLIQGGLIVGVLVYLLWFIYGFFYLRDRSYLDFFLAVSLNGFFSFVLGYFLWRLRFWSPGDGKLFGIYGLLFPLTLYSEFYIDYFPAYLLVINFALLFLLIITIKSFLHLINKRREVLNKLKDPSLYKKENIKIYVKKIINFSLIIATAMVFISAITGAGEIIFGATINAFIVIGLLFLIINLFEKLKNKHPKTKYLSHILATLYFGRFIVLNDFRGLILSLRALVVFLFIVGFFKKMLRLYVNSKEVKEIKAREIEQGMVLSREWRSYLEKKLRDFNFEDKDFSFSKMELSGGLTEKQAKFIQNLFKEDGNYKIEVCESFPFAPYIFIAALIVVITQGSYIHVINDIFATLIGY